jgi:hypothetical protein
MLYKQFFVCYLNKVQNVYAQRVGIQTSYVMSMKLLNTFRLNLGLGSTENYTVN